MSRTDDLKSFAERMKKRSEHITSGAEKLQRQTFIVAHQAVVSATPVDTGRARSNWIPSNGVPSAEVRPSAVPGEMGSTGSENTQNILNEGQSVARSHPIGVPMYIVNNLPYIRPLNAGHSPQAKPGFVEAALLAANAYVASNARAKLVQE